MEEHGNDSKMDPMDTDCVTASVSSEAVADGFQESMQSKSSHATVSLFSTLLLFRRISLP